MHFTIVLPFPPPSSSFDRPNTIWLVKNKKILRILHYIIYYIIYSIYCILSSLMLHSSSHIPNILLGSISLNILRKINARKQSSNKH